MEINIIAILAFGYLGMLIGKVLDTILKLAAHSVGGVYEGNLWFYFGIFGLVYPLT